VTPSKREEHPRYQILIPGGYTIHSHVGGEKVDESHITVAMRIDGNKAPPADPIYISLTEAQSMVEEARREARADMIREMREEGYRCTFGDYDGSMDKGWFYSVAEYMEDKDAKAKSARKPDGKAGTTTCTHGTPTDQRWEWCNAAATSNPEWE